MWLFAITSYDTGNKTRPQTLQGAAISGATSKGIRNGCSRGIRTGGTAGQRGSRSGPNNALQLTASSLRSCVAPAFGSS
jgi:hypothetical protein